MDKKFLIYFAWIFLALLILLSATSTINPNIILSSIFPGNFLSSVSLPDSSFVGGYTPLSISNVKFSSTNDTLLANTLALYFRTGGLGGWTKGEFSPSAVNSWIGSNEQITKSFSFKAGLTSERCYYPFQKDSSLTFSGVLRRYDYKIMNCCTVYDDGSCVWCNNNADVTNKCKAYATAHGGTFFIWSKKGITIQDPLGSENPICVYGVQDGGHVARILSPNYQFGLHSELTIDGYTSVGDDSLTGNIGTDSVKSATPFYVSGSQVGYLLWNGNLGTGNTCAVVDVGKKYLLNTQKGDSTYSWRVVDTTLVQDYYSKEQTLRNKADDMQLGSLPAQQIVDAIVQVNNAHNQLVNSANLPAGSQLEGHLVSYASKSGYDGALYYDASNPIAYPTFTLYIKADKLGFVQPTPKISNLKVQAQSSSKSGDLIPVLVSWTNSGQSGNFSVSVSCSGVYRSVSGSREISASANSPVSLTMNVQGTCSSNQSGSCTVTVTPLSAFSSAASASSSVGLSCSPEQLCQPNSHWCISNTQVKSCNSAGQFGSVTDCSVLGKVCVNGECQLTANRCGDGVCDFGEQLSCVNDCQSPGPGPGTECGAGYHLVTKDEPVWWTLGIVKSTTTSCEKDIDYTVITLGIIAAISFIIVVFLFRGKKRRRR